ncbi:MAG: RDD family protein [Gammaproteobacteria bacterium]
MSVEFPVVSFRRRIAAVIYDAIAVTAVVYFAAFVPVLAAGGNALAPGNPLFSLYLLAVIFAYFAISWRRGRTLGMQAWKIVIVDSAGHHPGWHAVILRFFAAALVISLGGLGYLASLFDSERRAWHDRWSGTRLVPDGSTARDDS